MKRLFIAVVLMIVSTAAHSQMFDGFIDGAGVGDVNTVISHLEQKGYKREISEKYPNSPLIFMLGTLQPQNIDVLIYMKREKHDTTKIGYICIYFPPSVNVWKDYIAHRKKFTDVFGKPKKSYKTKSYWMGQDDIIYTIGVEDGHVYHSLEKIKL